MRGAVLGSGSKANSYYFASRHGAVLVDNGFSYRELCRRLSAAGASASAVKYLFVTHSHSDHTRGVPLFLKNHRIPCFAHPLTAADAGICGTRITPVEYDSEYSYAGIRFKTFALSHDAPGAVGYSLFFDGVQCTIMTDTGCISDGMAAQAATADLLFLEANYCPDMLENGAYPEFVKNRIQSELGHLSNTDTAEFLRLLEKKGFSGKVFICHLSENNNTPERVAEALGSRLLDSMGIKICPRNEFVPFC